MTNESISNNNNFVLEESQVVSDVPVPDTPAQGEVSAVLNGNRLDVAGAFSELTSDLLFVGGPDSDGNPESPINLRIGASGEAGPIFRNLRVVDDGNNSGSFSGNFDLSDEDAALVASNGVFVNLNTENNPDGELRGQIIVNDTVEALVGEEPVVEEPVVEEPVVEEPVVEEPVFEEPVVEEPVFEEPVVGGGDTVIPSTSSLSLRGNNQGRATFTNTDGVLGNSGFDPLTGSAAVGIAAINIAQWEGSEASGAFIQVSGPETRAGGDPIVVQVYDLLPDRGDGLDLSPEAFDQIADPVDGIVDIDYELISPGDDFRTPFGLTLGQGIVAEGIEGTNPFFAALRFNNHRHPIESVELIGDDGSRTDFSRGSDNRFVLDGGFPINGVQDLEVTDIFGQEVILNDINITGGADTSQITGVQFGIL